MRRLIEGRNEGQISSSCCPHWNFYRFLFVGSWPFSSKDSLGRHSKKKKRNRTSDAADAIGRHCTEKEWREQKRNQKENRRKVEEVEDILHLLGPAVHEERQWRRPQWQWARAPTFLPIFLSFFFIFFFGLFAFRFLLFFFIMLFFFFGSFRPFHGHSSGQRTGRQVNRQRKRKKKRNTKIERRRRRRGRRKGRNWRDRRSGKRQQHKRRLLFRVLPSRTGSPWPARMIVDEQEIKQIKRISMEVEPWKRIPVEKEETRGLKKKSLETMKRSQTNQNGTNSLSVNKAWNGLS